MKAEQPRDLGGLEALIEVAKRQLAPEVIEDIAEIQYFRLQPAGKGPLAQAEAMGDRLCAQCFTIISFRNGSSPTRGSSASEGSSLISSE